MQPSSLNSPGWGDSLLNRPRDFYAHRKIKINEYRSIDEIRQGEKIRWDQIRLEKKKSAKIKARYD